MKKKILTVVSFAFVAAAAYAVGCCGCDSQKTMKDEAPQVQSQQGLPEGIRPCQCDCSKECKCPDGCECNVCRKCVEARAKTAAVAVKAEPKACSCQCKDECSCCKCHCGCCCNCMKMSVTETQKTTVVTNTVSVKEYKCGNRFFGASVTVTRDAAKQPTTEVYRETFTPAPPPPPPHSCDVWIEGGWGWAMNPCGIYVRRWVPGHYESCTVIY